MHWSEAYFADGQRSRQQSVTCAPASGGQALTGSFSLVRTVSYLTARTVAHGFGTGRCCGSRSAQEGGVRWNAVVAGAARPAGLPRTRSSGDLFGVNAARFSLRRRLTLGGKVRERPVLYGLRRGPCPGVRQAADGGACPSRRRALSGHRDGMTTFIGAPPRPFLSRGRGVRGRGSLRAHPEKVAPDGSHITPAALAGSNSPMRTRTGCPATRCPAHGRDRASRPWCPTAHRDGDHGLVKHSLGISM
jgi:hypothetical protein